MDHVSWSVSVERKADNRGSHLLAHGSQLRQLVPRRYHSFERKPDLKHSSSGRCSRVPPLCEHLQTPCANSQTGLLPTPPKQAAVRPWRTLRGRSASTSTASMSSTTSSTLGRCLSRVARLGSTLPDPDEDRSTRTPDPTHSGQERRRSPPPGERIHRPKQTKTMQNPPGLSLFKYTRHVVDPRRSGSLFGGLWSSGARKNHHCNYSGIVWYLMLMPSNCSKASKFTEEWTPIREKKRGTPSAGWSSKR